MINIFPKFLTPKPLYFGGGAPEAPSVSAPVSQSSLEVAQAAKKRRTDILARQGFDDLKVKGAQGGAKLKSFLGSE